MFSVNGQAANAYNIHKTLPARTIILSVGLLSCLAICWKDDLYSR